MTKVVKERTPVDTRHLKESISQKITVLYPRLGTWVAESGTETNVEYAPHVEFGTGLWGPRAARYEIRPRNPNGWLSWIDAATGERIFAKRVMHPGSPGSHMFAIGASLTEHAFDRIVDPALQLWALEVEHQNRTSL